MLGFMDDLDDDIGGFEVGPLGIAIMVTMLGVPLGIAVGVMAALLT